MIDNANLQTNLTQVARMLDELANQAQDLAALADMTQYGEQIGITQALIAVVQQLAQRMLGRYSNWARVIPTGDQVPCNVTSALAWNDAYDTATEEAMQDSLQAQTLISQMTPALQTLLGFIQQAMGVSGSVSGLQTLNGVLGNLATETARLETSANSFQEVMLRGQVKEVVNNKADVLIEQTALSGITGQPAPTCPNTW